MENQKQSEALESSSVETQGLQEKKPIKESSTTMSDLSRIVFTSDYNEGEGVIITGAIKR